MVQYADVTAHVNVRQMALIADSTLGRGNPGIPPPKIPPPHEPLAVENRFLYTAQKIDSKYAHFMYIISVYYCPGLVDIVSKSKRREMQNKIN
jgi:hypothetical protein